MKGYLQSLPVVGAVFQDIKPKEVWAFWRFMHEMQLVARGLEALGIRRKRKPVCPHATGTGLDAKARTTTMKIKTTTAFRAYANARATRSAEQAAANARFMVKSVNKDGSISRMAPTRNAWKYDAFATAEEAEKRRAQLEAMNPGHRYVVVAL